MPVPQEIIAVAERASCLLRSNWTLGCVSLENKDVEELYRFVQKKTAVEIIR